MARYLRDEQLENITINSDLLSELDSELQKLVHKVPEYNQNRDNVFLVYTIRFDQKGYRVFSIGELLSYFHQAKEVERIIIQIETEESLKTNRAVGSYLELRLDKYQMSFLTVRSDDEVWMKNAFSSVREIMFKHKNKHGYAHNAWVELLIQLFGVLIGFALSLIGATKIAPSLKIENSFLISFLLVLFMFSNLWSHINLRLVGVLNYTFPVISFYRKDKGGFHWLIQAIVGGIVVAIALYLLNWIFSYMGEILGGFVTLNS